MEEQEKTESKIRFKDKLSDLFFSIFEVIGICFELIGFLSPVILIAGIVLLTFLDMKIAAGIVLIIGVLGLYSWII